MTAGLLSGFVLTVLSLVTGYPVHLWDLTSVWERDWLGSLSSARWLLASLANREYSTEALAAISVQLTCRNKQVCVTAINPYGISSM